jgi:hypothetical protein
VPQDAGNHIFNITVSDSAAAAVGRNFTLQVNASDPDGDRITYSDDTGLFDINGTTGLIEFTPGSDQVGLISLILLFQMGLKLIMKY